LFQADINSGNDADFMLKDFIKSLGDGQAGDVWLVKGEAADGQSVHIQARYLRDDSNPEEQLFIKSLALGGDFLEGNTLIIRPTQDNCTWNGKPILVEQTSIFQDAKGLVKAKRHTDAKLVENIAVDNPGLDVELPNGVKLLVNRQRKYVNLIITMAPLKSQDGLCGNFNGQADDDSLEMIEGRDPRVAAGESMFPVQ